MLPAAVNRANPRSLRLHPGDCPRDWLIAIAAPAAAARRRSKSDCDARESPIPVRRSSRLVLDRFAPAGQSANRWQSEKVLHFRRVRMLSSSIRWPSKEQMQKRAKAAAALAPDQSWPRFQAGSPAKRAANPFQQPTMMRRRSVRLAPPPSAEGVDWPTSQACEL